MYGDKSGPIQTRGFERRAIVIRWFLIAVILGAIFILMFVTKGPVGDPSVYEDKMPVGDPLGDPSVYVDEMPVDGHAVDPSAYEDEMPAVIDVITQHEKVLPDSK